MSVTRDMLATYRGPQKVIARFLDAGPREDRALAFLMAGCGLVFVAQWPRLARQAHQSGEALNPLLGGSLMAWVFIAPLAFYFLAFLSLLPFRLLRREVTGYAARLALFWALLASAPILLLHGMIAGFIGPGPGEKAVGLIWLLVFGWFWIAGLVQAGRNAT
ncbi:hypothetical protein SAMN04490248_105175 [Salinihabitans flavidus]|uniref:Yip1 domain-containing protein n=1 Tax=Salinihabitans flavidus TaxID=569882 RepID=A0A1H8PXG4_9RHOB|nr:YIP1 family protein [Salinihabitans flavidus]SEO46374.1 hypothetical protein SAMN04490248_105175 [Salinihabitans flavidus]